MKLYPSLAKITASFTAASILAVTIGMAVQPSKLEVLKSNATQATMTGAFHSAVDQLTQALNLAPNDMEIRKARGEAKMHLHQYQSALDDLIPVHEESPSTRLAARIAWCHAELQNYDTATRLYQRLVQEFPDSAVFHNNLGYVLSQEMQLKRAIEHFDRALEIDDQLSVCYLNRAESVFLQALRSDKPTPDSALDDVRRSRRIGLTGAAQILRCQISATVEPPNEREFLNALHTCRTLGVPRHRLENDPLLTPFWREQRVLDALDHLPSNGNVTKPRRLVPPFR